MQQLLRTKFYPPETPVDFFERDRLLAKLAQGGDRKLTLICAPAGYGKTSLVVSWLRKLTEAGKAAGLPVRTAWYTIDETDNDLFHFVGYFVAVVHDAESSLLADLASRFVTICDKIKIERKGGKSAVLTKDLLNVLGDDFVMKFDGGDELHLKGNFLDHEYTFYRGRDKIGEVSNKWFRIADTYGVQISAGEDEITFLAAAAAIDQMSHDGGLVDV